MTRLLSLSKVRNLFFFSSSSPSFSIFSIHTSLILCCCIGEFLTAYWCFLGFRFSISIAGIIFLTNGILDAPWPNEFWRIGKKLGLKLVPFG
jgi:hypothetical protein